MTYYEDALAAIAAKRTALDEARAHADATLSRLQEMTAAREGLTSKSTEAEIKRVRVDAEVAEERHTLAMTSLQKAEREYRYANDELGPADVADRHRAQHEHGVAPILSLQVDINAHLDAISKLQATQVQLFQNQVVPRNDRFQRTLPVGLQAAPSNHYESVQDVIVRGQGGTYRASFGVVWEEDLSRQEANRAERKPHNPAGPWADHLTDEERDQLAFVCEKRGQGVAGDLKLTHGISLLQLMHLAGIGKRVEKGETSWVEISGRMLGEISAGLPRAMAIAKAQSGADYNPGVYHARRTGWASAKGQATTPKVNGLP